METRTTPDQSRRDGVEAFPIILADGNTWGLALPTTRLRPKVVESIDPIGRRSETIRVEAELGYPLEIRRLIEELRVACDRSIADSQYESLIRLAVALIRRAHDIDLTEATALLELDVENLPGLVEAVLSVVTGGPLENCGLMKA